MTNPWVPVIEMARGLVEREDTSSGTKALAATVVKMGEHIHTLEEKLGHLEADMITVLAALDHLKTEYVARLQEIAEINQEKRLDGG